MERWGFDRWCKTIPQKTLENTAMNEEGKDEDICEVAIIEEER